MKREHFFDRIAHGRVNPDIAAFWRQFPLPAKNLQAQLEEEELLEHQSLLKGRAELGQISQEVIQ
jgi:hypothetical protein